MVRLRQMVRDHGRAQQVPVVEVAGCPISSRGALAALVAPGVQVEDPARRRQELSDLLAVAEVPLIALLGRVLRPTERVRKPILRFLRGARLCELEHQPVDLENRQARDEIPPPHHGDRPGLALLGQLRAQQRRGRDGVGRGLPQCRWVLRNVGAVRDMTPAAEEQRGQDRHAGSQGVAGADQTVVRTLVQQTPDRGQRALEHSPRRAEHALVSETAADGRWVRGHICEHRPPIHCASHAEHKPTAFVCPSKAEGGLESALGPRCEEQVLLRDPRNPHERVGVLGMRPSADEVRRSAAAKCADGVQSARCHRRAVGRASEASRSRDVRQQVHMLSCIAGRDEGACGLQGVVVGLAMLLQETEADGGIHGHADPIGRISLAHVRLQQLQDLPDGLPIRIVHRPPADAHPPAAPAVDLGTRAAAPGANGGRGGGRGDGGGFHHKPPAAAHRVQRERRTPAGRPACAHPGGDCAVAPTDGVRVGVDDAKDLLCLEQHPEVILC
mmetsp:Transcript_81839/g.236545  ORF Transcript_81839/g.236545 Transcript_81839/m.236545 type:complete len:500 (+) Transcript_81839:420-1919(+)